MPPDDRPPAHILLVEDDPLLRDLASASLVAAGHRVSAVGARGDALAMIADAQLEFDLLISDVSLFDGNGLDVATSFRTRHPERPVLLISGFAPESYKRPGAHFSEFAFLEKPFRSAELRTQVDRLLDRTESTPPDDTKR